MTSVHCSVWKGLRNVLVFLRKLSKFSFGDGLKIGFWSDPWCTLIPFSRLFPHLYKLSSQKKASVAYILSVGDSGDLYWNVTFITEPVFSEIVSLQPFVQLLSAQKLGEGGDVLV